MSMVDNFLSRAPSLQSTNHLAEASYTVGTCQPLVIYSTHKQPETLSLRNNTKTTVQPLKTHYWNRQHSKLVQAIHYF